MPASKEGARNAGDRLAMKTILPIVTLSVALLATHALHGQNRDKAPPISPAAISKIVKIVLRGEFKSADKRTPVYISEKFIQKSWLPKIRNIEFVLIDDAEFKKRGKAYFFPKAPYWEKDEVRVDFGFGDSCSASGGSWFFHVTGDRVRDANKGKGGGWATGCGRDEIT